MWRKRRRRLTFGVAAEADTALREAVKVVRALGGRITRLDVDGGSMEARLSHWAAPALIAVHATDDGTDTTWLAAETDARGGAWLLRRLRARLYTTFARRSSATSAGE